mmetsp:Transcript_8979/g.15613  ORF Transcript_8979/g.15613 Transcript_8979/m.15613 type:complete len:91 (-) Transcript_8979:43-315(-)
MIWKASNFILCLCLYYMMRGRRFFLTKFVVDGLVQRTESYSKDKTYDVAEQKSHAQTTPDPSSCPACCHHHFESYWDLNSKWIHNTAKIS